MQYSKFGGDFLYPFIIVINKYCLHDDFRFLLGKSLDLIYLKSGDIPSFFSLESGGGVDVN